MIDDDLIEDENLETKPAKRRFEPINRYDYCLVIARMVHRPVGYILKVTQGWPMEWFYQIQSECKSIRDPIAKIKFIMWFIREAKLKNIK